MTEEAKEKAMQEFARLEAMPPMSAEGTVARTYLDWLINVPWKARSEEIEDLGEAEKDAERGPLRAGEDKGTHPGISGRSPACEKSEGHDPVLCRRTGRRED